ncbi:hypothetical protein MVEN_00662100 [Mycena venus]|uniref:Uncharacterized protein n=1 Tax=Mycena venus TaxID=2733690 RepID=A0A8H6YQN7_9AGAR|nr:hypothetical protein MVEN_00662100 [Mycena venus]
MFNLNDFVVQLKITSATCSFFALGSTLYRLYQRRGRFGADDYWAVFAFVALIVQSYAADQFLVSYLIGIVFYAIVWGSRLSILFSIIRIDPTFERRRRLFWVAVAFIVVSLILIAQLFWVCVGFFGSGNQGCRSPLQIAVCQLITDIVADSILLFAPLPLFRNLINKALRRRLTLIFSTCVVTTVISLVHAVLLLRMGSKQALITAVVESCLSLIVANIPVVVTTIVDIAGDEDQSRTSETPPFSTMFWYRESVTTTRDVSKGVVAVDLPMHLVSEESGDNLQLQCTKTIEVIPPPSNQDDLESEQADQVARFKINK